MNSYKLRKDLNEFIDKYEQLEKDEQRHFENRLELLRIINKAIEFIIEKGKYDKKTNLFNGNIYYFELSELLEILKGEDNE